MTLIANSLVPSEGFSGWLRSHLGIVLRRGRRSLAITLLAVWFGMAPGASVAQTDPKPESTGESGKPSLEEIAQKLNDPTSNVWALQAEFDWNIVKGDSTHGDNLHGGAMLFQPVLPIPLTETWKILTRPVLPVIFGAPAANPVVTSGGRPKLAWDTKSGFGDIVWPVMVNPPPVGHFSFAGGPSFGFPTATHNRLGSEKWLLGPAGVAIFKTKRVTTGFLAQHWWNVAGDDGRRPVNKGSILYFAWYMLPDAWQIGMSPTISYDLKADPGNKLNLPIGFTIGKTVKIGSAPTKFQLGFDYSLVRQDNVGQSWKIKLAITPVIPGLINKPIF